MMRKIIYGIFCCLLLACHRDDEEKPIESRTVLVYMAGDNSLNQYVEKNIQQMMLGMKDFNGNFVVYADGFYDDPVLIQLTWEHGKAVRQVLETYPEENSSSPETLLRVIQQTRALFPADSYGLVLWSHGMGWLPVNYSFSGSWLRQLNRDIPQTKFWATDDHPGNNSGGQGMALEELARVLPRDFSFILFDACFMGGIEVVYQLREHAEYIIASPAEVIADGFPYREIVSLMCGGEEEYRQICQKFRDYYQNIDESEVYKSATVCLIKTSALSGLAEVTREILQGRKEEITGLAIGSVWRYPLIAATTNVFFDFGDYIRMMATDRQYEVFRNQLNQAVVYKAVTEKFNNIEFPSDKYSGLSAYIPLQRWENMQEYYLGLDWSAAVY